ncbi:hypothetical protein [Salinimicrobium sediminilitoris]|uniref:hypothetical protein n=1 Tax=Salinimicrobium sediminilitoris TaxID=2876715 RepID=UPI001E36FA33|nr:hypothetical protein [Salinimicrobium sediminilitoris]MCC8360270.1 hypothetical protein [Salinimicrobium sediminilitoris]
MLDNKNELRRTISTVTELFDADKEAELVELLRNSEVTSEPTDYDNWNGGITYYSIYIKISVERFVKVQDKQAEIEAKIKEKAALVLRIYENIHVGQVYIIPKSIPRIEWDRIVDLFTKDQLISEVNYLKDTMISVSTGGQRIQDVNDEFQQRFALVDKALKRLTFENPNPFNDLWQWYARWSSGEMPQYKNRRAFIGEMYGSLLKALQESEQPELLTVSVSLTGWERIDRTVKEIKMRLRQASTEEQFQTVGLLCRETIISIAQAVYEEEKHPTIDGVKASKTDSKRMLDAYIAVELGGRANENLRKYARASNALANELTHKRTANLKDATICSSATISLVNLIGILEDRH